jgi:2-polyprenyl-6-methoxyphenol hydroxylase-like FAD-dependent oxidoreductase
VNALANVSLRPEHDVTGLLAGTRGRVHGVRLTDRNSAGGDAGLHADLVVDASGRTSRAAEWLEDLGCGTTPETVVNAHLGYAMRWYRPPYGFAGEWKGLDVLDRAEPLTPVHGYQRTENRLRHFERLARWPDGFIAVGDAVCAFNPVYGQGMSAAAVAAAALRETLQAVPVPLPAGVTRGFQRQLAALNQIPWLMAAGEDFRWPSTEGERPPPGPMTWLTHGYADRVIDIIPRSPAAHRAFIKVWHMTESSATLLHPRIVADVLRLRAGQTPPAKAGTLSPVRSRSS